MIMEKVIKITLIILTVTLLIFASTLLYFSIKHHTAVHRMVVEYLNREFGSQVTFRDFSLSYLRSFPRIHIELLDMKIYDGAAELLTIHDLDVMLNLRSLWRSEIEIERMVATDLVFNQLRDSLGGVKKLPVSHKASGDPTAKSLFFDSQGIEIRNALLSFNNQIKKNRSYIRIHQSRLKLKTTDAHYVITGQLDGSLDSLISNNQPLFVGQPVTARDIVLKIDRHTGVKELEKGTVRAHSLVLTPRVRLEPFEDGQKIELEITGEDDFDDFLGLFEFHLGFDLRQVNPNARLSLSYRQSGFVNPYQRPYSELDFEISEAVFEEEDLPYPVVVDYVKGNYNNGKSHSPETVELVIDSMYAEISHSYVGGHFRMTNLNDPIIDAYFDAKFDLGHLVQENDKIRLTGMVDLELLISGKLSEFRKLHLEGRQQARGVMSVRNLELMLKDEGQLLQLGEGTTILNNHIIEISRVTGTYNASAFHFKGHIENLDQYLLGKHEKLLGKISLNFDVIDLENINLFDSKKEPDGTSPALAFSGVSIEVLAQGKRVITPVGELKDMATAFILENDLLKIDYLRFNYQEGRVESSGKVRFDQEGIAAALDVHAGKLAYKDLVLSNTRFHLEASRRMLDIRGLRTTLPFGDFSMDMAVKDYLTENIRFKGGIVIDIDTLSVSDLMKMDYLAALSGTDGKETGGMGQAGKSAGVPDNIDISLQMRGDQISYEDILIQNMDLEMEYSGEGIRLEKLDLGFAEGKVHLNGYLNREKTGDYPGYIYLKTDDLDLRSILDSFGNFNQDAFTNENSTGKISTASHHYFTMDRDLGIIQDDNFWLGNVVVHHAEFDRVEPLDKTLFFIGHKARDTLIVSELDVNIMLAEDRLFFRDLLMNDNIANLALSGEIDLDAREMDLWAEISLSDLFFRSKSKRIAETQAGIVDLEHDSKLFLQMSGPLSEHHLKLENRKRYEGHAEDLQDKIDRAQKRYKKEMSTFHLLE